MIITSQILIIFFPVLYMASNGTVIEVSALASQDDFLVPTSVIDPDPKWAYEEMYNPFVADYANTIKFARGETQATPNGSIDFGQKATVSLETVGVDLVNGVQVEMNLPEIQMNTTEIEGVPVYVNKVRWVNNPANNVIERTWVNIGGTEIESHTSQWLDLANDIKTHTVGSRKASNALLGQQNLKILNIGSESMDNVQYLTRDDIQILSLTRADLHTAPITDTVDPLDPTETVSVVTVTADYALRADSAAALICPAEAAYAPAATGPFETEGIVTQGYDGLQTYKHFHPETKVFLKLKFWFCNAAYLALPILSLSVQGIRVSIKFRKFVDCIQYKFPDLASAEGGRIINQTLKHITESEIYVTAIYVDEKTRDYFIHLRGQIMIQLVDCINPTGLNGSKDATIKIESSHPSDEILWTIQDNRAIVEWVNERTNFYMYDPSGVGTEQPLVSAQLMFSNNPRTQIRSWMFWRYDTMLDAHYNVPDMNVYGYSFSLEPEEYQVTSTANFSRLVTVTLKLSLNPTLETVGGSIRIYNIHRNFFRILGGVGGLLFSS